ncbi:CHAT domain-containing protein [Lactifluus subvellereus]|nr:CHAT domain-containing protein [Lactifluus subvellereus]
MMLPESDPSHALQKPVDVSYDKRTDSRTQTTNARTHESISHEPISGSNDDVDMAISPERRTEASAQSNTRIGDYAKADRQNPRLSPTPVDLADKVKGMYRLLDLIGESGSNGYVDKIVIAQDSLQRFINAVSPGTYASITKVNFKALDQFVIKPLGVYGSKSEIVRLLQSMGAIDENVASLLLVPADVGDPRSTLSSGLYIVRADTTVLTDERHYVIYWPEDTTWNDSSTSSVLHTREAFMRYLTKLCDQVVALLSSEHSASIVWDNQRNNNSTTTIGLVNSIRKHRYGVSQTSKQKESVVTQPGFQMTSHHISPYETPLDFPVGPTVLTPHLLPGETSQGFMTVSYIPRSENIVTDPQELVAPELEFQVHVLDITSTDKQDLQLDPKYIPKLLVNDRLSSTFRVPSGMDLAFFQILENEKFLLVLLDEDSVSIYLERLSAVDIAVERNRPIKRLNRQKLGERILFAFDETKRALVVCASTKLHLYMFAFDETFRMLHLQGAPLVSNRGMTKKESPSCTWLSAIFSSPDGSCLLVLISDGPEQSLTAYHWETFGSNAGIPLDVPKFPLRGAVLTSMVRGGRVFLVGLDIRTKSIQSIAIDITTKRKEYTIERNDNSHISNNRKRRTEHNSLLDCHAQVWSRFPVIPAVKRRTVTSSGKRQQKSITFITEIYSQPFGSYFSDLIQTFERTTRKPTSDELRHMKVSATQFEAFREHVVQVSNWGVSRYCLGEWLVDLLCLIPIHIAVSRENTFIPLADGIVDKLSFGWYESIFRSYLATKPVRVVSSMGPQSIGKSFLLNHFLDTSFAGSAMRTTEGVWMSVTPTDTELIVALDFEGVGSIERTVQEDTLLVLFNTAISNLVLFCNNFAFGRDISGFFQSFQASASVLDPEANPSLFRSTLLIIIKASVQRRCFSLRLTNLIEFYEEVSVLKEDLDDQQISHPTAREFLHTIKTLMAKLKACFPRFFLKTVILYLRIDQRLGNALSGHGRTSRKSTLRPPPNCTTTGYSETEPDLEHLKNLDTDLIVECDDTATRFPISDREVLPADIIRHLGALRESWNPGTPRQSIPDSDWVSEFGLYIGGLIDLRVRHVQLWLASNLKRFEVGHATVEDLRRKFDKMQEHETSHGSMTQTCWGVEGPDEEDIELGGRTFSSNDDGTSMMCNLVCSSMGRHVHIDYCRSNGEPCKSDEVRHINARITPNPDRPKDAITHSLYWRRMGFKDPYTRDEQISFGKCDAMCSALGVGTILLLASYVSSPRSPGEPVNGSGYVSSDGHLFECRSPAAKKRAFHVIFIIDSSGSMLSTDHQPLADTPVTNQIRQHANNRLGAAYSALYSFWSARHVVNARDETISTRLQRARFRPVTFLLSLVDDVLEAIVGTVVGLGQIIGNWITGRRTATTPRDAYSVILFNDSTKEVLVNDTTSSPDELLKTLISQPAGGSRDIPAALRAAEAVMVQNWSPERLVTFPSLCSVSDEAIRGVCRSAIEHGKPLSLHAVSFGGEASTSPLPKMANLALKIQKDAARSRTVPEAANIPSTFTTALDTVHLTTYITHFDDHIVRLHYWLLLNPYSHPERRRNLINLAIVQLERRTSLNINEGLDEAILHLTEAILLPLRPLEITSQYVVSCFFILARSLLARFLSTRQPGDLIYSIAYLRHLLNSDLSLMAINIPRQEITAALIRALGLQVESEAGRATPDIEEMVALCHELLALDNSGDHLVDAIVVLNRSACAAFEARREGSLDQVVDQVVDYTRLAIEVCPPGSQSAFMALAQTLALRFTHTLSVGDFQEAIALFDNVTASHPLGNGYNPDQYYALFCAARLSMLRFEVLLNSQSLDEAMSRVRTALVYSTPGDHNHSTLTKDLTRLTETRSSYFHLTGHPQLAGPSTSQEVGPSTLRRTGTPDKSWAEWDATVDVQKTCSLVTIDRQIQALQGLLSGTSSRTSDYGKYVCALADWYSTRFFCTDDIADLEKSIEWRQIHLVSTPSDFVARTRLLDLGMDLFRAFQQNHKISFLEESISLLRYVVEVAGEQGVVHHFALGGLHKCLLQRWTLLADRQDLDEAIHLLQLSIDDKCANPPEKLQVACTWANIARLYAHLLSFLRTRHAHLVAVKEASKMPLAFASYHVQTGRLDQAIETLEQGRALLWSEMRGLRTSIDRLTRADPVSATRLAKINQDLETLMTSILPDGSGDTDASGAQEEGGTDSFGQFLEKQRTLLEERNTLIAQIQRLPGFENFLKTPSFDTLRAAASRGPVIIVNHCEWRSDILIVLHDSPPSLITTAKDFYDRANDLAYRLSETRKKHLLESRQYQRALRSVLQELYRLVGQSVMDKLRELNIPEQSRVWWCPTSVFCSLPLHAMGPIPSQDKVKKYFSDVYISSYTPTLFALIKSRDPSAETSDRPPSLLVIAPPEKSLPGVRKEIEVIKRVSGSVDNPVLKDATSETAMESLRHHRFVHFACHGILEAGKPFDASFKLHDDDHLTLLDIVRSRLPSAEFALLSACHTAELTDGSIADEALHLTAAIQYCGFRSVVGTMWAMADTDGRDLAEYFYEWMFDSGDHSLPYYERSAKALRDAVRKLRGEKQVRLEQWVNFVHYGA